MANLSESTLVMVDDCMDEIYLTERRIRREGIVNRFVSASKPEDLENVLGSLVEDGVERAAS